jgi:hypothetical protein
MSCETLSGKKKTSLWYICTYVSEFGDFDSSHDYIHRASFLVKALYGGAAAIA